VSDPEGASIYVDEMYFGKTPHRIKLRPGTHRVKLAKSGYEEYTSEVVLAKGQEALIDVELERKPVEEQIGPIIESAKVNGATVLYIIPTEAKLAKRTRLDTRRYPVVVLIGHPFSSFTPNERLERVFYSLNESTIAVRSGILDDDNGPGNWWYANSPRKWRKNRKQFLKVVDFIKANLPCDEDRIYLTGYSFDGIYAWMLAYDRPDLYAGVVAASARDSEQIERRLRSGKKVVTVVLRGDQDHAFPKNLRRERKTGKRMESYNKYSKWILFKGLGHRHLGGAWDKALNYILQFRRHNEIVERYKGSFRQVSDIFPSGTTR